MKNKNIFDKLIVLDLANNHFGDLKFAKQIIKEFSKIIRTQKLNTTIKFQFRDLPNFIHVGTIFPGYVDTPLTGQVEGGMDADKFASIVIDQIKNEEHIIVSHAYNSVHIEKRMNEITQAYKKYAPRYDGDDEYDVKTILSNL